MFYFVVGYTGATGEIGRPGDPGPAGPPGFQGSAGPPGRTGDKIIFEYWVSVGVGNNIFKMSLHKYLANINTNLTIHSL